MAQAAGYIELAYSSIRVFADDGTLDMGELNCLLGIALKDGQIDEDEKRVLRNIFAQVSEDEVSEHVWVRMQEITKKYDL